MPSPVVELDDRGLEPFPITAAAGLLEVLDKVADPRTRRGRRFELASILAVALAATLAGARSFTAIGEWAAETPAHLLARLGLSRGAPSEKTIRRTLQRLDADALDATIGAWMWLRAKTIGGVKVISFDGKTMKGARDTAGKLVHLLSGICQATGVIIGQVAVGEKTSEVPKLRALLAGLDIAGAVITADALHTCRETAEDIIAAGAHYIFVVKANQPLLRKQLKALPWNDIPTLDHSSGKRRHGRLETRSLKAAGIGSGIRFPGATQALRMHRTRTVLSGHRGKRKQTRETIYVVTSLDTTDASHNQIANWLRGHWAIENRVHWVRDTAFDEDRHQARTGTGPQVLATPRNTAISLLRLGGHTGIAQALRRNSRNPQRPIEILLTC
jgi:predicted transposase YbfD/YdcC